MVNVCNKYYKKYQQQLTCKKYDRNSKTDRKQNKKKISYYFIVLHFKLKMSLYFAFAFATL